MNTKEFEGQFFTSLEQYLGERHPTLECTIPSSGTLSGSNEADILVTHPASGAFLAIEVKAASYSGQIPLATLPQMSRLQELAKGKQGRAVLVVFDRVPASVRDGLSIKQIPVIEANDPAEAVTKLESAFSELEKSARHLE